MLDTISTHLIEHTTSVVEMNVYKLHHAYKDVKNTDIMIMSEPHLLLSCAYFPNGSIKSFNVIGLKTVFTTLDVTSLLLREQGDVTRTRYLQARFDEELRPIAYVW